MQGQLERVKDLVLTEVNVKDIEFIHDTAGIITKKIKPNFKTLGKKYGKQMKEISSLFDSLTQEGIAAIERCLAASENYSMNIPSGEVILEPDDYQILSEDMPGWLVATEGKLTVALDITISDELRREGVARELINRVQNLRKECNFDVTDKIVIELEQNDDIFDSLKVFKDYLCSQTLAVEIKFVKGLNEGHDVEWENDQTIRIKLERANG